MALRTAWIKAQIPDLRPNLSPDTTLTNYIRKKFFDTSGYCKYGLYHDDILYDDPDVFEAIKRLPPKLEEERNWRLMRAVQLEIRNEILPKEEWTKFDDDYSNRYLQPYLQEVRREWKEMDDWKANYY